MSLHLTPITPCAQKGFNQIFRILTSLEPSMYSVQNKGQLSKAEIGHYRSLEVWEAPQRLISI